MANYRQIHVSIWKDEWFLELDTREKLFFIYLFSNENASLSGIYKIAMKVMIFETGLDQEFITSALAKFEKADKAYYRDGVMWVKNMRKYNQGGPKVFARILQDVGDIPDGELKQKYIAYYAPAHANSNPIDTPIQTENTPVPNTDTLPIQHEYCTDRVSDGSVNLNGMKLNESNGANAPASPDAPKGTEGGKLREKVEELQTYFLVKTGLPVPRHEKKSKSGYAEYQKLWGNPLGEILGWSELDVGTAQTVVDKTIARMRSGRLTISDPNSIIKTARAIWGEMHVSGNGNGAEVPAEEYG